jgi:photosystem II stability/assembly factor-like uncharacterized protein
VQQKGTTSRFNTRTFTVAVLCLSISAAVWLGRSQARNTSQDAPLEPRWEQAGQIKFVVLNPITEQDGWHFTWTGTGVWRSDDQDTIWEEVTEGLPPAPRGVTGIASHGGRLFATMNKALYVSDYNGEFWEKVGDGIVGSVPMNLAAFAGRGGKLLVGAERGLIYQSLDGGTSWHLYFRRLGETSVNKLMWAGNTLMAATNQGVWMSEDEGTTWHEPETQVRYWLPGKVTIADSEQVTTLTTMNNKLFAATWGGGVFRSDDAGQNWFPLTEGLQWEDSDEPLYVKTLQPAGRYLLAGTRLGVFLSPNLGNEWKESNDGYARRPVDGMFTLERKIYATNLGTGAYVSGDNGLTWDARTFPENVAKTTIGRVAGFHDSGDKLWALSGGTDGALGIGFAYSNDAGKSWIQRPQINNNIRSQVLAGGASWRATPNGVLRSVDDWETSVAVNQGLSLATGRPPVSINALAAKEGRLIAGSEEQGVFTSAANTNRWTRSANRGLAQSSIRALALKDSMLLAGTRSGGVYVTENNGDDWQPLNERLSEHPISDVLVGAQDLWAATKGGGVFCSNDNGQTWKAMNNGLGNLEVNDLALHEPRLVAATNDGVFVSPDNGESWSGLNNGLQTKEVTAVFTMGSKLFAGTVDGRILFYNTDPQPEVTPTPRPSITPLPRFTPTPGPTPTLAATPEPTPAVLPFYHVMGRVTDHRSQGLANVTVTATDSEGNAINSDQTDRNGYYSIKLATGGTYRLAPPSAGPRVNFTQYYANPGHFVVRDLRQDQTANFAYSLTAPWTSPE